MTSRIRPTQNLALYGLHALFEEIDHKFVQQIFIILQGEDFLIKKFWGLEQKSMSSRIRL